MLNALSVCLGGGDREGRGRARRSFERQDFIAGGSTDWDGCVLDTWMHPSQRAVENSSIRTPDGFACCVGPLWYRGQFGVAALRLLIGDVAEDRGLAEGELKGNFALFVRTSGSCLLMNDALGFVRLYVSPDRQFYSTSWLATCAYAGSVDVDENAAAEYVLLGASHSDGTVASGVTTLPLAHSVDLAQCHVRPRFRADTWTSAAVPSTFNEAVDEAVAILAATFKEIAAAFPGRVRAALSAGFDSRLIVAGLMACGERPALFVYGGRKTEDVSIACEVAASAGLRIEVIDKGALNSRVPAPDIERLVQSALFFDGLPNDGIVDAGADQRTRLQSMAGGYLSPNGGGGEIFRNFFHLPDRSLRVADVVKTFYRGFDSRVFRRRDALRAYEHRMVTSMKRTLGMDGASEREKLRREQVELIYPLFRCHHWMAVNNSIAVRHGYYATPLIDWSTVRISCRLPLAWKNAGLLESHLISRLHRGLATQPSSHGFRFADGPDRRARFNERAMCARPVFARPLINATRRRLQAQRVSADMLARYRALLPGEWRMDPVLDLGCLPDNQALGRALAVEIAWRKLFA